MEGEPWRGQCVCRETNWKNNRDLRSRDREGKPSSIRSLSLSVLPLKTRNELTYTTFPQIISLYDDLQICAKEFFGKPRMNVLV